MQRGRRDVRVRQGGSSNPALASRFYSRACDGNYAPGCNNLAWLYLRGHGVPRDQPHAMLLFMAAFDSSKLACARGDASGCLLAGELLFDGPRASSDGDDGGGVLPARLRRGESKGCDLAKLEE